MLEDKPRGRILFHDGTSVVSVSSLARKILEGTDIPEGTATVRCRDTEIYKLHHGVDFGFDESMVKDIEFNDHAHTEDDLNLLLDLLEKSPRFEPTEECLHRIEREIAFFVKTSNIVFLLEVKALIERFRNDGIIWGVGRGSACSSYVLYLLEVHDVHPIKYKIDFRELTKDYDDDE